MRSCEAKEARTNVKDMFVSLPGAPMMLSWCGLCLRLKQLQAAPAMKPHISLLPLVHFRGYHHFLERRIITSLTLDTLHQGTTLDISFFCLFSATRRYSTQCRPGVNQVSKAHLPSHPKLNSLLPSWSSGPSLLTGRSKSTSRIFVTTTMSGEEKLQLKPTYGRSPSTKVKLTTRYCDSRSRSSRTSSL